jgi:choline dehydrogenase-like flavoprotein
VTDVLIVGSGASGVNAAYPLVEAGYEVKLLDFGNQDSTYDSLIPPRPFSELRRFDEQQHRYFLGENFQGIPFAAVQNGAQLTPPRLYITRDTERMMPVDSRSFIATESLALGGLASGWGAGVFPFTDEELPGLPISRADLEPHYEAVAERIGVAGDHDDLMPFFGDCTAMMAPPRD